MFFLVWLVWRGLGFANGVCETDKRVCCYACCRFEPLFVWAGEGI